MADRTRVWILRAALYGLAGLLLCAILYWRTAYASEEATDRAIAAELALYMAGKTSTGDTASGSLDHDGRLEHLFLGLRLRCTPDPGHPVWAAFEQPLTPEQSAGGRVRLRLHGLTPKVSFKWRGRADLVVDARYDVHRLAGTASATMALDTGTMKARCRASRATFTMRSSSS